MATTESFNATTDYDYYTGSPVDEVCERESVLENHKIFSPVFFSIVVILSLFGNILVIVILSKYENLKSLSNTFILNLVLSDLLFTAGLPFWAYYYVHGWTLGAHLCRVVSYFFYVGFYSSGIILILMTIHRYVAVMNPLSDIVSTTGFYSILVTVITWATSMLISSPHVIFTKVSDNQCDIEDTFWSLWVNYQQNIVFLTSSVVFIFCYSRIIWRLLHPTAQRRRNKTLKLIFILIIVFILGWGPYNIALFLHSSFQRDHKSSDSKDLELQCQSYKQIMSVLFVCRIFAFSHCCINPVFYVFVGVKYKNHLKKLLKSLDRNRGSVRSRHSRLTITSLTSGEELSI